MLEIELSTLGCLGGTHPLRSVLSGGTVTQFCLDSLGNLWCPRSTCFSVYPLTPCLLMEGESAPGDFKSGQRVGEQALGYTMTGQGRILLYPTMHQIPRVRELSGYIQNLSFGN